LILMASTDYTLPKIFMRWEKLLRIIHFSNVFVKNFPELRRAVFLPVRLFLPIESHRPR
jgi:hypothetical protein